MSLCDACYRPGTCCKEIRFYGGHRNGEHTFWLDENIEQQVSGQDPENLSNHPFEVLKVDEKFTDKKTGREYGTVVFKCKNLTAVPAPLTSWPMSAIRLGVASIESFDRWS